MKVHLAGSTLASKCGFVSPQSLDPEALIFNSQIFDNVSYFPLKSSEGCKNIPQKVKEEK